MRPTASRERAAPTDREPDRPDAWIPQAVAQACALRETVRGQPDLRVLVDVILLDLATRIRDQPPDREIDI